MRMTTAIVIVALLLCVTILASVRMLQPEPRKHNRCGPACQTYRIGTR